MNKDLIFDIGAFDGEDSARFLKLGYSVVSVDCNPQMEGLMRDRLSGYAKSTIERKCIWDKSNEVVTFYASKQRDWSSVFKKISNRDGMPYDEYRVSTIRLDDLMRKYGVPLYLKIDIEGYDNSALRQLIGLEELPMYVSAESECLGSIGREQGEEFFVLDTLKELGYTRFKIIQQHSDSDVIEPWGIIVWDDYDSVHRFIEENGDTFRKRKNFNFWFDIYAAT